MLEKSACMIKNINGNRVPGRKIRPQGVQIKESLFHGPT